MTGDRPETGRRPDRVPASWFADLYRDDPDPWRFATSPYEARKFDLTVACLPRPSYRSAFEPGCAFGALTARLAPRCERLLAADAVPEVVDRARDALPGVDIEVLDLPEQWPAGPFDLVVLSELAYYFPAPELDRLLDAAVASLEAGGDLLAVHWLGPTSYPLPGDVVARRIGARPELDRLVTHLEAEFELGVWRRR